jgi:hypothetical protein
MPFAPALRYQAMASRALRTARLKKTLPLLPFPTLRLSALLLVSGRGRSFVRSETEPKSNRAWDADAGK